MDGGELGDDKDPDAKVTTTGMLPFQLAHCVSVEVRLFGDASADFESMLLPCSIKIGCVEGRIVQDFKDIDVNE